MRTLYCGIDAGSSNCHVAMMNEAGKFEVDVDIPTSELQLTAFLESLQKNGEKLKVHLEAAELAQWIRGISVASRVATSFHARDTHGGSGLRGSL